MVVRQTNDPVQIFDYIEGGMQELVQDGCPIVGIIIDSIRAIRYPKDIKEKTTKIIMGGTGAPYLGSAFKGILPVIREHMITTILVQQVAEEMDEYKKMLNPWRIPDGMALKHFADYMLEVTRIDTKKGRIEEGKTMYGSAQQVGHKVRIRAKKNKVGAPYRCAEFSLSYTAGIINVGEEIYELAKSLGVVTHPTNPDTGKPNNSRWLIGNHDPMAGEEKFKEWFLMNKDVQDEAMAACYACQNDAVLAARNAAIDGTIDIDFTEVDVDDVDI